MRYRYRSPAILAAAALLVGACGVGGTASLAPTPTQGATTTPSAAAVAPASALATPTPAVAPARSAVPTAAPTASPGPKAPARVTGSSSIGSITNEGVTKTDADGRFHVSGVVIEGNGTTSDQRVNGSSTLRISIEGVGAMGWETASLMITNAGGSWEGTCRGATWASGNASDLSCWVVGKGGYQGLTYYYHLASSGMSSSTDGLILPVAAP